MAMYPRARPPARHLRVTSGESQLITSITPLANEAALCAWCHEVRQPCDATLSASLENGDHVWLCTTCFEQQVMSEDEEMPSIDGGPEDSDDDWFARNINPISMAGFTSNRAASSNRPSGPAATDVVRMKPPPPCPAMDRDLAVACPVTCVGGQPPPVEQPQPWRKAARKAPPPVLGANRPVQNPTVVPQSICGSPPPKAPPPGYAFINGVETYLNMPEVGWLNHYCRAAFQRGKFPAPRTTLEGEYQIAVKSSVKMPPPRSHMETDMQVAVKMGGKLLGCRPPPPKPLPGH